MTEHSGANEVNIDLRGIVPAFGLLFVSSKVGILFKRCNMPAAKRIPVKGLRQMAQTIAEGKKAPAFTMPTDGGGEVSLKDFKGKKLVMFFYPKDNTPGCTTESNEFSENLVKFRRAGADILGVSRDSVNSHDKFKAKQGLKIALASDAETNVIESWGSWVEKKNYGRTYMGIERSTFLIDESGKIKRIWRKVRVKGHVEEVLAAVRELKDQER